MNRFLKSSAASLLMIVGASCSSTQVDTMDSGTELDPLASQEKCVQEWRDVLAEWEAHRGEATTLRDVRTELEKAKTLRISKLARQAWELQGDKPTKWTGRWPVADGVRKGVISTIDAAADGVVSADCQQTGVFILPSLLGEEVASGRSESPLHNLDVSSVDASRSDTTRIGQWIFFGLFAGER